MRSAFEVVATVMEANPVIDCLTLVTYTEAMNWGERSVHARGANTAVEVEGLQQDRHPRILTRVLRNEFSIDYLRQFAEALPDNQLVGLGSRVSLIGGGEAHIPMMDFKCSTSPDILESLLPLLRALELGRGYLLQSGRSYHYYGIRLLSEIEWRVFLGRCLLMSGYSDDRYIGHQLVDGYCALRLSSGRLKNRIPSVVAEID